MILLRGVSQVEKEPEGCTWNESLAWIVRLGKGWISWTIKMKDWVGKALRCCAPFSARGEQGGGRVWPPHQRAVPPWQEAVPSGPGDKNIPLLLFPAWPPSSLQLWAERDDGTHLLDIGLSQGLIHYTSCDNYRTFYRGWRDGVQSVLVIVPLAPVLCSCREVLWQHLLVLTEMSGKSPTMLREQWGTAWGEELKSSSCFPARGGTAEAGKAPPRNKRVSSCSSSSAVPPFSPSTCCISLYSLCHVKAQRGASYSQQ